MPLVAEASCRCPGEAQVCYACRMPKLQTWALRVGDEHLHLCGHCAVSIVPLPPDVAAAYDEEEAVAPVAGYVAHQTGDAFEARDWAPPDADDP
jgi:hypothetical protein